MARAHQLEGCATKVLGTTTRLRLFWVALELTRPRVLLQNLVFKCVDLAMQFVTLYYLLEAGLPVGFAYGYACVVAGNAWTRAVFILWEKHSVLGEVVLDFMYVMNRCWDRLQPVHADTFAPGSGPWSRCSPRSRS